jgi:hypothetical protein
MIPVWIIDELAREEELRRQERRRERLELPISRPPYPIEEDEKEKRKPSGPIVIEF